MNLRKIIGSIGAMTLIFNFLATTPIFGAQLETTSEDAMEERYRYIVTANSKLSINGGVATITADMSAKVGAKKTLITSRLQRKVNGSWETVEAWTESSTSNTCRLKKTKSVSKGYEYRVFSTIKAYTASDSESIAVYSSVIRY
ncbi:MAG: hypothetical protein ACRCX2_06020 [Paraclostridium sp.]